MTGYKGSWLKGFASTFDPLGGLNLGLQWKQKKEAQKKIDDEVEQFKLDSAELAEMYDKARADGRITAKEYGDAMAWALPLGKEIMGRANTLYANYQAMTPDQLKIELGNIDAFWNFSKDLDYTNLEQMKEFGNKLTQPDAKMQWDLIVKSVESRGKPKVERYATLQEFQDVYGDAPYKHDSEGFIIPTFAAPKAPAAITDYQRKRTNIQENPNLSEGEKLRGIYKLDTGIDIGKNDTEDDFTTAEGKRTLDLAFNVAFGYTTPDGIKIAGIVPSRLATQLSLGRQATEEEKEAVYYDWNVRKGTIKELGGTMAVKAIEDMLTQMFRITKKEDIVEGSVLDKALEAFKKKASEVFGGEGEPQEGTPVKEIAPTGMSVEQKIALIPTLSDDELKEQANVASQEDVTSQLYKALYDECKERGLLD